MKKKEEGNYKRYPLWENIRVAYARFTKVMGGKALALTGADISLSVAQPFTAMALPSAVVYLLGSGWQPGIIFLALAGYVVVLQAMQTAKAYLSGTVQKARFLFRIKQGAELFEAALSADFQKYESTEGQEKLEAARRNLYSGNDVGVEAFLKAVEGFVIALIGLFLYSVILGSRNIWLLLLLFSVNGVTMAVNVYADRRAAKYDGEYIKAHRDYAYLRKEVLVPANGKDMRLYRMWDWFQKEFQEMTETLARWSGKERSCAIYASIFAKCIAAFRDLLVYGYLIRQMALGQMDLAAFLLYVGIVANFAGWMDSFASASTEILHNNRYMDRYRDFLEYAGMPDWNARADKDGSQRRQRERTEGENTRKSAAEVAEDRAFGRNGTAEGEVSQRNERERTSPHELRLEHVSFRYEGTEEDAVHDLTLTIKPGEKIALVGRNGAGKSTLTRLLCGLYRPASGKIYLDGRDITLFSPEEYRKEFAVVFQEVFAFSFPLADNVSCKASGDTDRRKLEHCLREAGLWERVQELPKKEQTSLNKDLDAEGVSLSGGELQRLMLARALYKDAPVVILDEPTAALDPLAESRMYEKYYDMTENKTSIFISHRLSSTKFCDRILYMEKGRITEEGTHSLLMEKQGAYAAMFHTQAQYYEKDGNGEIQEG